MSFPRQGLAPHEGLLKPVVEAPRGTLARGARRFLLEAWVEDGKGGASGSAEAACEAAMSPERVALGGGAGLELELADWSDSDPGSCYPTPPSPLDPPKDTPATPPHRLPSLVRPGHAKEQVVRPAGRHLCPALRLTDHLACVGSDAVSPSRPNRENRAYLRHVQRLAGRRPIFTHHRRLPDIPRRPGTPRLRPRHVPDTLKQTPNTLSVPTRPPLTRTSSFPLPTPKQAPRDITSRLPQTRPRSHLAPFSRGRPPSPSTQPLNPNPRSPPWAERLAHSLASKVMGRAFTHLKKVLAGVTPGSHAREEVWDTACEREMSCRAKHLVGRVLGRQALGEGEGRGRGKGRTQAEETEENKNTRSKKDKEKAETEEIKRGKGTITNTRNRIDVKPTQQGRREDARTGRKIGTKTKSGEHRPTSTENQTQINKENITTQQTQTSTTHNKQDNEDPGNYKSVTPLIQTLKPTLEPHNTTLHIKHFRPFVLHPQSTHQSKPRALYPIGVKRNMFRSSEGYQTLSFSSSSSSSSSSIPTPSRDSRLERKKDTAIYIPPIMAIPPPPPPPPTATQHTPLTTPPPITKSPLKTTHPPMLSPPLPSTTPPKTSITHPNDTPHTTHQPHSPTPSQHHTPSAQQPAQDGVEVGGMVGVVEGSEGNRQPHSSLPQSTILPPQIPLLLSLPPPPPQSTPPPPQRPLLLSSPPLQQSTPLPPQSPPSTLPHKQHVATPTPPPQQSDLTITVQPSLSNTTNLPPHNYTTPPFKHHTTITTQPHTTTTTTQTTNLPPHNYTTPPFKPHTTITTTPTTTPTPPQSSKWKRPPPVPSLSSSLTSHDLQCHLGGSSATSVEIQRVFRSPTSFRHAPRSPSPTLAELYILMEGME